MTCLWRNVTVHAVLALAVALVGCGTAPPLGPADASTPDTATVADVAAAADTAQTTDAAVAPDVAAADSTPDAGPKKTLRVLFIGNSFTNANGLINVVAKLGESPQSPATFVVAQHYVNGAGWDYHVTLPEVATLIAKGWDHVVLQDQSSQPWGSIGIKASLLGLNTKIVAAGAKPMMFMTWAYQAEDYPDPTHFSFALAVNNYYERHGAAINAPVAPIGRAWERARRAGGPELHWDDGIHPNILGTYLAACVLYETLTGQSPVGLNDGGTGIAPADQAFLQQQAWQTRLDRQRLPAPAVGVWPLGAAGPAQDLAATDNVKLGDVAGPDGKPTGGTTFGPAGTSVKVVSLPYFAGLNPPQFTLALRAYKADWAAPTKVPQLLAAKSFAYGLLHDNGKMTARLYTTDLPVAATLTSDAPLSSGWHHLALTYDGALFALWQDGAKVGAIAATGAVRYYQKALPDSAAYNGIALGAVLRDNFEGIDEQAKDGAFTGALADVRLFDRALAAAELAALAGGKSP